MSFRTGDIYGYVGEERFAWRGRKEDYIQVCYTKLVYSDQSNCYFKMSSGESLDPRVVEAALDQSPAIFRSCVVGNNFLRAASQVVCAIIEPSRDKKSLESRLPEITRAIAVANRSLAPPLRISWARVLVLKEGQEVPITKKGAIFRKKLEQLSGEQLSALLTPSKEKVSRQPEVKTTPSPTKAQGRTRDQISSIVAKIVFETLKISEDSLDNNSQATFAEVRMCCSQGNDIYE